MEPRWILERLFVLFGVKSIPYPILGKEDMQMPMLQKIGLRYIHLII